MILQSKGITPGEETIFIVAGSTLRALGYFLAAIALTKFYNLPRNLKKSILFGLLRTVIGLITTLPLVHRLKIDENLFIIAPIIAVVRFFEWFVLIMFFYDKKFEHRLDDIKYSIIGVLYSLVFDFATGALIIIWGLARMG
jgi:hypothetical protein